MKPPLAIVALLLASLLGTAAASAQAPPPGPDRLLEDPALAPARPQIERAVSAAQSEGLPSDWLLDKVAEGLSKRVPAPRIAAAVEVLLTRMRAADRIVRDVRSSGPARRPLLRAAVDALMAGAPAEALAALVSEIAASRSAGTEGASSSAAQALVTVSELAEREFGGAASVEATRDAWRTGRGAGVSRLLQSARRIRGAAGDARDGALREAARARGPVGGVDPGADRSDSFGRGASSGRGPDRR